MKMKQTLIAAGFLLSPVLASADAPLGADCGWGNMLFDGQSGFVPHILASTTNGSTYNNIIGAIAGTNGCSFDGALGYGGTSMISMSDFMDDISHDVAQGEGEALDALMVMIGIEHQDRSLFKKVAHENFDVIFSSADVTAKGMLSSLTEVMKNDAVLSKYAS